MNFIKFIKNPRVFIGDKAALVAENKIKQQNFIPITETKDEDIFIAGYPKSGNTWVQNLMASILLESASQRLTPRLVFEIVPDVHAKQYYKRFFPVMFFKTHHLPKPQYKKVIHLVRDGRDAMVSYYKMEVNKDENFPFTLEDMIKKGTGIFPSKWYIHTQEWIKNPYKSNIITVKYENLLQNTFLELKRICDFAKIEIDDNLIKKVIKANEISKLKARFVDYGTENEHIYKNKHVSSFFRKGEVGNFKEHMPPELIKYMNKEANTQLRYFKYI